MRGEELSRLAGQIRRELDDLERLLDRIDGGWKLARGNNDTYFLDSVALNLHGFYSGLERIFVRIAEMIDDSLPIGGDSHQQLLVQMTEVKKPVRPAVISKSNRESLDEFRRFRHVVRNVYTFHFNPERIRELVESAPVVFAQVKSELLAFADFLER